MSNTIGNPSTPPNHLGFDTLRQAIRFKHNKTKEIAEYDSVMGLFYVEGKVFRDTGNEIPISRQEIQNDQDWEYLDEDAATKDSNTKAGKRYNKTK